MTSSGALIDELGWRGLIHDSTDLGVLREHLDSGRRRFYIGFDPTAPSLTIGNLVPMALIVRGARAGLEPVVLFGGGTGLIGDPSGRSSERSLLRPEEVAANAERHRAQMEVVYQRALDADAQPEYVDNHEWLSELSAVELLRDVGKHFPMAELLRRDAVRRRLDDPDVGLTYTEFSYALLQAYDFMRLRADRDVTLQFGASDQWGNIVAGIDYVRRVLGEQVHGLTCPLLTRSDGAKFGKSEQGAVWIAADRTSPYTLYQFLLNLIDDDAVTFARFFSLEDRQTVERWLAEHADSPARRTLQRRIAGELCTLLHGAEATTKAEEASRALFSGDVRSISADILGDVFADVPTVDLPAGRLDGDGVGLVELLVALELAKSRREAREHLGNGAVLVNGERASAESSVGAGDLLHGSVVLVRRGKREWRVARFA